MGDLYVGMFISEKSSTDKGVGILHSGLHRRLWETTSKKKNRFATKNETYMIMGDVMKEDSSHPAEQRPIDSRESTTKEGPFFLAIMWNSRIRVMKICEHHDPFSR